ncbi:MAG: hypothetical protein ACOYNI_11270 [Acidimicrobiia bacterium]
MAVLFGVLSALGFGVNDYVAGIAARRISVVTITFWIYVIELPFFLGATLIMAPQLDALGLVYGALGGTAAAVGLVAFYRALAIGRFSVVAAISGGLTAAVPAAVGYVQGDRIGMASTLGVLAMAVGIVVVTAFERPPEIPELEREHAQHPPIRSWFGPDVPLAVFAGLLFSGTFVGLDAGRARAGEWALLASNVVPVIGLAVAVAARKLSFGLGIEARRVGAAAIVNALASLALFAAFGAGALGVASAAASFYPVVTGVCAFVFLKERVRVPQAFGLALAVIALGLLAVGELQ